MKTKIVVVEDDPHIRLGLQEVLKGEGYEVTACARGDEAERTIERVKPGLIILDVMLPGASGFDICKALRKKKTSTPILMLTAKGQEMDKVVGLGLGADDYVTKPFGVKELLARIQALLRRTVAAETSDVALATQVFALGSAEVDPKRFELRSGKRLEALTAKELKLLQLFHARVGEVLSRDFLLNEVWGYDYYGTTRTLDQTLAQLRKKVAGVGVDPELIETVHGVGYRLVR
jgi:DNA-binding response OmpR family regulator